MFACLLAIFLFPASINEECAINNYWWYFHVGYLVLTRMTEFELWIHNVKHYKLSFMFRSLFVVVQCSFGWITRSSFISILDESCISYVDSNYNNQYYTYSSKSSIRFHSESLSVSHLNVWHFVVVTNEWIVNGQSSWIMIIHHDVRLSATYVW